MYNSYVTLHIDEFPIRKSRGSPQYPSANGAIPPSGDLHALELHNTFKMQNWTLPLMAYGYVSA